VVNHHRHILDEKKVLQAMLPKIIAQILGEPIAAKIKALITRIQMINIAVSNVILSRLF
jgi:hypothetical protein